ncbi:MAG: dUTP diphosphatase [Bacilli bacterium]
MRKFEICKGFENKDVILPERKTKFSAGYDFFSNEDCVIKPGEVHLVPTGVKAKMEPDDVLKLYARSSLGVKRGLMLVNSVGIVDSDYYENEENDGHIMIALYNFSNSETIVKKGERIAQGVFSKYLTVESDTCRTIRKGGFGSTK